MTGTPEVISAPQARRLLLRGLGLCNDPQRTGADAESVHALIRAIGFVQVDSINIVERAHHHIVWARAHAYRPRLMDELQASGRVFEHWTHDASIIPSEWFPHWRPRFADVESWAWSKWLRQRLGRRRAAVLTEVLERVRSEGPRMARDFEHNGRKSGPWWDWKPAKAALEYWWRGGALAIPRRVNFHKVYDLTERVLPQVHGLPAPDKAEHIDWACRTALERLGAATPREIAAFWAAIDAKDATTWCAAAVTRGEAAPVLVEGAAGERSPAFAVPDWRRRAEDATPPAGPRILSPFDPLVRDRRRLLRLFGFDYRFEGFVPEGKRKHGYYVLPVLEGDRLIARLDPKLDRDARVLHVRRVWWEPRVRATRSRQRGLDEALARYAEFIGAEKVKVRAG